MEKIILKILAYAVFAFDILNYLEIISIQLSNKYLNFLTTLSQ